MRALRAATLALVLLAPFASASVEGLQLVAARLDYVSQPTDLTSKFEITLTLHNPSAVPQGERLHVLEFWLVTTYPFVQWEADTVLDAGETREVVATIHHPKLPFSIYPAGPNWLCLDNGSPQRCWSVWTGTPMPNDVYPENIPSWELLGVPMGDTP